MQAGTKYRGEFEERVEALVREATQEPKSILFIDEIHLLLGAGQIKRKLGFGMEQDGGGQDARATVEETIRRHLRPELVNRLPKVLILNNGRQLPRLGFISLVQDYFS